MGIREGRRFLKWTYAHGFFATFTEPERKLFEFQQAQLEGTLERLSDVMENHDWYQYLDTDAESFVPFYDIRSSTISLTGVARKFFSHLREAIEQDRLFTA